MKTGLGRNEKKGGNQSTELYNLQVLARIQEAVNAVESIVATEATLISVLNAIVAADQDLEILLVRDTGNGDLVVQQITNWETGTPVVEYKTVAGAPYTPVGPLEYLDPSAVLNLILAEMLDQGVVLDNIKLDTAKLEQIKVATETTAATGATEATLELVRLLGVSIDGKIDANLTSLFGTKGQKASSGSAPVVLSTEQQALIETIDAVLDAIKLDTAKLEQVKVAVESINVTTTAGQSLTADSLSVALSTEQQALIDQIESILTTIKVDTASIITNTSDVATETTLATLGTQATLEAARALLQTIDVDTSNLAAMLTELQTIKTSNALLGTQVTAEASRVLLASIDAAITANFGTLGQKASAGSAPVVLSTEQQALLQGLQSSLSVIDTWTEDTRDFLANVTAKEATLADVKTAVESIALDTPDLANIKTLLTPTVRTHNTISTAIGGTIAAGSIRGSVFNAGDEDGTWNGITIPAGVSIPWDEIGNRDTYGAISYDPTTPGAGTTFIIEYTT